MKNTMIYILICFVAMGYTQTRDITFKTQGQEHHRMASNPFQKFIGEWTLKDDCWTQNWEGKTETIKIPMHHTVSTQVNTANSLFSIVDGPEPNGHIFWSYNPITKAIHHLSSFGELRAGVGKGSINEKGDVTLKITFQGEPKNTYRIYTYQWITKDEYHMKSVQYGLNDSPTGLFYEGSFVRLQKPIKNDINVQIEAVLAVLDNHNISVEEQLKVYTDNVAHMPPGDKLNSGKDALRSFLNEQRKQGVADMKHEILDVEQYGNIVVMRGQVTGTYHPKNNTPSFEFRTKNVFVFHSQEGTLKINKVIYNHSPLH